MLTEGSTQNYLLKATVSWVTILLAYQDICNATSSDRGADAAVWGEGINNNKLRALLLLL